MKASEILMRARDILQDADAVYWSEAELLRWLNDARLDAYKLRPDIYEATELVVLVEGFRQKLPNGSRILFSVARNISSPKQRAIALVQARNLERVRPNWRSMTAATEIKHYMYDVRDSGHFDVYPPARANVRVEVSYAKPPVIVSGPNDNLAEEGAHVTALVDYVLYRAFLKEADTVPAFHARALQHLQAAVAILTGDVQAKETLAPNQ